MSSRSRREHERIVAAADTAALPHDVEWFEADYGRTCDVCGARPCVTGLRRGRVVYASRRCGACTFGNEACADPAHW